MRDDVVAKNWHVTAWTLKNGLRIPKNHSQKAQNSGESALRPPTILWAMPTGPTPSIAFLFPPKLYLDRTLNAMP